MKTLHTAHGGKMSIARVLGGSIAEGAQLVGPSDSGDRVAGVFKLFGQQSEKRGAAAAGDTVALGKLDHAKTGETLSSGKQAPAQIARIEPNAPVLAIAAAAKERKDDVKLGQALNKLVEEDPSLTVFHNPETHEVVMWGQGEMHLRVAGERLSDRFGVGVVTRPPSVGYRETIRKAAVQRGRHKKQSGGHGQFGDVVLDIKPLPRSTGFKFEEKITGGVVPRNYIPSVEEGVLDALKHGPLGFPVVDIAVTLVDGSYHTVDSSDMAFRQAGRIGVADALAAMSAGAAGADPRGGDRLPERCDGEDQRHHVGTARTDPRLRYPRGLAGLGYGARDDAGGGDRRSDRRGAVRHRGRRQLHLQVRPYGRTDRAHRRPDRRGEEGQRSRGVAASRRKGLSCRQPSCAPLQ